MLCKHALSAYEKYGMITDSGGKSRQRGMLVNYESLPGSVPKVLLPLFGVEPTDVWLAKMAESATKYSKGRGGSRDKIFTGDSQDKDTRATDEIVRNANLILQPTYEKMEAIAVGILQSRFPSLYAAGVGDVAESKDIRWESIKLLPGESHAGSARRLAHRSGSRGAIPHSLATVEIPFSTWSAFANSHSSRSFEVSECHSTIFLMCNGDVLLT